MTSAFRLNLAYPFKTRAQSSASRLGANTQSATPTSRQTRFVTSALASSGTRARTWKDAAGPPPLVGPRSCCFRSESDEEASPSSMTRFASRSASKNHASFVERLFAVVFFASAATAAKPARAAGSFPSASAATNVACSSSRNVRRCALPRFSSSSIRISAMRRPSASSADGAKWKPRADGSARNFQAALRSIAAACGDAVGASLSVASANARQPRSSTDARASSPHNVSACNATLRPWSPKRGANDATRDVNRRHPFSFVFFFFSRSASSPSRSSSSRGASVSRRSTASLAFSSLAHAFRTFARPCSESFSTALASVSSHCFAHAATEMSASNALCDVADAAVASLSLANALSASTAASAAKLDFSRFWFCIELCVTSASLKETHPVCETLDATNASSLEMPLYAFASSCAFIADAVRAALRATLFTASSKISAKFLETSSPSRRTPFLCRLTFIHQSRASSCPSACSTFAHTRAVVFGASVFRRTRRSATTARAKATFSDSSSLSYSRSEDSWSPPTRSAAPREEQSLLLLASTTNSAATLTSLTPFGND